MATRTKKDWAVPADPFTGELFSFPVTVRSEIGRVTVGDGHVPAHVAAFVLIAEHDTPGIYEFPMADGQVCTVEVSHTSLMLDG